MDHLSKKKRSEAMKKVGTKSTAIEKLVRSEIKNLGFRFSTNSKSILGRPDIVLRSKQKIIFVHGCFWHLHNCKQIPKSNRAYWETKLLNNKKRDRRIIRVLKKSDWSVLVVWECWRKRPDYLRKRLAKFLGD
jgi:DNA mismatch endonuclease (patch repair protein)